MSTVTQQQAELAISKHTVKVAWSEISKNFSLTENEKLLLIREIALTFENREKMNELIDMIYSYEPSLCFNFDQMENAV